MAHRCSRPHRGRLVVAVATLVALAARPAPGADDDPAAQMAQAANRLILSLDEKQRDSAVFDFDSRQRTFWHYSPSASLRSQGGRPGLPIKEMAPEQRMLAHGLLSTALSHQGYLQSMTIIMLEAILRDLEGNSPARDPEMYHVAVFGKPSTQNTWGWSLEGHHLSVNLTLVDGRRFCVTPSFFGSNPAQVRHGRLKGIEALWAEQHLARRLVRSLSPKQRKLAVIAEQPSRDILTRAERKVDQGRFLPPRGISLEQLEPAQQEMLLNLVGQFTDKYRRPIIEQIDQRTPITEGRAIYFAWAGGLGPGEGHYYRVQTLDFLFEYDNTQDGANHIHAVWRQFDGDFGQDLLRRHYQTSAHHARERSQTRDRKDE